MSRPLRWWRASCDRALDFLGRFLLRLAFYQRDLLDARGIGWTPGGDLGIVFESIMNEASLVGIHRFKLKRTAGDAHALSQLTHPLYNSIFAHGTIMLAVDNDFFSVVVLGLQQPVKQELDGLKRLAITPDETPAFLSVNLQRRVAAFVGSLLDVHHEAEITKHRVEQIFRRHHRFRFPAGATFSSVGMG